MRFDLMWVWWAATIGICAWKIIEGFVRPRHMLEWPFLASAMWAYFYGYMGYDAKMLLSAYMPGDMAAIGQLMALLCLIAVLLGWQLAMQGKVEERPVVGTYQFFWIWAIGVFFVLVGAVGGYSVMRAVQSGTMVFQDASAYWYLLFYVGYPGMAMAIWALCRMKSTAWTYLMLVTVFCIVAFMFPHVSNARRGPLFPAMMVLLLVPPLARRKAPNPWIFVGGLVLAGVVMMLFLQIRDVIYKGGSWGQAIQTVDVASAVTDRGEQAEDNEYVNSAQLIGTIYQNGKYQYGTGHLSLLLQWVPRAIWKDKPVLGEGSYSFDEMFDDVEAATGVHLLGTGAADGGVADTFVQYGVLCPLFWFGLSWLIGRVYVRARSSNNPAWLFCYVGFICASHWLVSQSVSAAFVPGMFFQIVPFVVFLLLNKSRRPVRVPIKRRALPRITPATRPAATP